jgi:hypothetical protein
MAGRWRRWTTLWVAPAVLIGSAVVVAPAAAEPPATQDASDVIDITAIATAQVAGGVAISQLVEYGLGGTVRLLGNGGDRDIPWPGPSPTDSNAAALAIDRTGVVTVAAAGIVDTECDGSHPGTESCPQLWFSRFTAGGDEVGGTAVVDSPDRPIKGLADGSILTTTPARDDVLWRTPDGTVRADLGITPIHMPAVAVDTTGRLLTATSTGEVMGWSPDGTSTELMHDGCGGDVGAAIGADDAGGFALACGSSTGPVTTTITRFDAAGAQQWSTRYGPGAYAMYRPDFVGIEAGGRIWLHGVACDDPSAPAPVGQRCAQTDALVRAYDESGSALDPLTIALASGSLHLVVVGEGLEVIEQHFAELDVYQHFIPGYIDGFSLPQVARGATCAPSIPTISSATGTSATLSFASCGGDARIDETAPTRSVVKVLDASGAVVLTKVVDTSDGAKLRTTTIEGLTGGAKYRFQVTGENDLGSGPTRVPTPAMTPPFRDLPSFVKRQYLDLVGTPATSAQVSNAVAVLDFNSQTPAAMVDGLLARPWSAPMVDPITRLYRSYFGRNPDTSGLRSWVAKRRAGTRTLASISATFAGSSEFKAKYGSLSNRAFVERVYQNVLGRDGDQKGIDYWTGQLDSHRQSRGQVMLGFSESHESVQRTRFVTAVVDVWFGLLNRAPTATEASTWVTALTDGTPRTAAITTVLSSPAYAGRIAAA